MFVTMDTVLIQTLAAKDYMGRVMGLQQLTWRAEVLGALIMGALGETLRIHGTLAIGGAAIAATTGLLAIPILLRVSAGDLKDSGPMASPAGHGGQYSMIDSNHVMGRMGRI